jgi:hypothetical protein
VGFEYERLLNSFTLNTEGKQQCYTPDAQLAQARQPHTCYLPQKDKNSVS